MALSKESIRKLRAVKAAILAEPELYNQDVGFWDGDHLVPACLLVWAVWLHNPSPKEFRAAYERKERRKLKTPTVARIILGITPEQANCLFGACAMGKHGSKRHASNAGRFIEGFISRESAA